MDIKSIKIKKAKAEDLSTILDFVNQLAFYEKEPESVTTDLMEYEKCFAEGIFEAIIAYVGSKAVGMALFYDTFSTWKGKMIYLEDFIVLAEYRRLGIGEKLFDTFIDIAKKKNAKLVKWQVLDWNTPALDFYHKKNATIEKNWWNGKIIF
jgi:GNAT superfamily N-acetyltransferase